MEPIEFMWTALGSLRLLSRMGLGAYFLFQGLNAWFKFRAIPAPQPALQSFLSEFAKVKGFMAGIKISQVIFGLSLLLGQQIGLSLLGLGVLITGISLLQWQLNQNPKFVVYLVSFYLVTLVLHGQEILNLLL